MKKIKEILVLNYETGKFEPNEYLTNFFKGTDKNMQTIRYVWLDKNYKNYWNGKGSNEGMTSGDLRGHIKVIRGDE